MSAVVPGPSRTAVTWIVCAIGTLLDTDQNKPSRSPAFTVLKSPSWSLSVNAPELESADRSPFGSLRAVTVSAAANGASASAATTKPPDTSQAKRRMLPSLDSPAPRQVGLSGGTLGMAAASRITPKILSSAGVGPHSRAGDLPPDARDVAPDGVEADVERPGDVRVRVAVHLEREHLQLACREPH